MQRSFMRQWRIIARMAGAGVEESIFRIGVAMFDEYARVYRARREQEARAWEAWNIDHAVAGDYAAFCSNLPESEAVPDFALARTFLHVARREKNKQAAAVDILEIMLASIGGIDESPPYASMALAIDPRFFFWSSAEIELRERFFSSTSPLAAKSLALAAMEYKGAPWRRWSCASPIAADLFSAFDALGHKEPVVLGKCASLSSLMGFAGHPVGSWIKAVALASEPASFISGGSSWRERPLGAFATAEDSAVAEYFKSQDLGGLRRRSAINNSTSVLACQAPFETVLWSSIGLFDHPKGADGMIDNEWLDGALFGSPSASLASIERAPFLLRCLSQKNSGLPVGFDHRWPIIAAGELPRSMRVDPVAVLIGMGASSNDIFTKGPVWESIAAPRLAPFSHEYYAPFDESLLLALLRGGADFSSMLTWGGGKFSLSDCCRTLINSSAAPAACALIEAALAKRERDVLNLSTAEASRALSNPRRSI